MGPEEADPTESRPTDVPLRAVPRLLQGGEGLQREVQVPLQDEDAGESSSVYFLHIFFGGLVCFGHSFAYVAHFFCEVSGFEPRELLC